MYARMRSLVCWLSALMCGIMLHGEARADNCYVILFGASTIPQKIKFSHSWATFVRVPTKISWETPIEMFTISWLPEAEELRPLAAYPCMGANLDLANTFRVVKEHCEYSHAFGPYEIQPEFYALALHHLRRLEGGGILYKTIDFVRNTDRVSNCVHGLTAFNLLDKITFAGRTNFGAVASYYVARNYRPWIINPECTHPWVADLLDLTQHRIYWRKLDDGRPWPSFQQ